jgi:hypothetical protein
MPPSLAQHWQTIRHQLAADKKKAAVLAALSMVLGGVLIRQFGGTSRPPPATAAATDLRVPPPDPRSPTVRPTPQPLEPPPLQSAAVPAPAVYPATRSPADKPAVSVLGLPRKLHRDPFNTGAWGRFMPVVAGGPSAGSRGARDSGSLWASLRRGLSAYNRSRREQAELLRRELAELQLQSTLTGDFPLACISGRFLHPGDSIRGFSVVRIDDRRVTLARAGRSHELNMP